MTEPTPPRPVPGPPADRPGRSDAERSATQHAEAGESGPFAGLADRPVSEHVAVFEAEHARLQRELDAIDQL